MFKFMLGPTLLM